MLYRGLQWIHGDKHCAMTVSCEHSTYTQYDFDGVIDGPGVKGFSDDGGDLEDNSTHYLDLAKLKICRNAKVDNIEVTQYDETYEEPVIQYIFPYENAHE